MIYGYLADGVVALHVGYIGFVLLGQLAIVVGACRKWQWVRNPWFRTLHLLAIAFVVYECVYDIRCPLTVWEEQLRAMTGQTFDGSDTFMGRLLHDLMFIDNKPEIFFTTMYVGMLAVVVQGFVMYPPRLFRLGCKGCQPAPAETPTVAS